MKQDQLPYYGTTATRARLEFKKEIGGQFEHFVITHLLLHYT